MRKMDMVKVLRELGKKPKAGERISELRDWIWKIFVYSDFE
jgi:hypothetical protein